MITKTAMDIAREYCGERDPFDLELVILRYMEQHIRIERELCAKIADEHATNADDLPAGPWAHGWQSSAKSVALSIRNMDGPIPPDQK